MRTSTSVVSPRRTFEAVYGRGASLLALALVVAGVGVVGFHAVVGDRLVLADREALATLLGVLLVCAAPFEALFVLTVRRAAGADGRVPAWRRPAVQVACGAIAVALGVAAFLALGGREERILAVGPGLVAVVAAIGAGIVPRGVLVGSGRLVPVAVALVIGTAVRFGLVVALLGLGAGLAGATVALLVGEVVTTALLWHGATRCSRGSPAPALDVFRGAFEPVVAFVALSALGVLPTVLAHRYLGGLDEDRFVAAYEAARIMLFLPQAIAVVGLARFARGGPGAVEALRVTLRIAAVSSLATALVLAFVRPPFARSLAANAAAVPGGLLLLLGLAACTLGLLGVLVTYHVARGLHAAGTVLGALGVAIAAALVWHPSLAALAATVVVVGLLALARMLAGPALVGPTAQWAGTERRRGPEPGTPALELSVIVPYYNPGDALRQNVLALVDALEAERVDFEVVAVSDGSTDGSEQLIEDLGDRVRTVVLGRNRGKGAALCAGLEVSRGRYLGFIDADGDIPPELWHSFLTLMELYEADMIVGSKRHALSDVSYPPVRRVYSRVFQALVHALFRVDVTDTQTGIKLFRREVLVDVLPLLVEDGFVFDLELLVIARRRRWRRVIEAPVRVEHRFRSTISLRTAWSMLWQTLVLAGRVHVTRSYDVPAPEPVSTLAGTVA